MTGSRLPYTGGTDSLLYVSDPMCMGTWNMAVLSGKSVSFNYLLWNIKVTPPS